MVNSAGEEGDGTCACDHLICYVYKQLSRSYSFLLIATWTERHGCNPGQKHGQELLWGKLGAALCSGELQQATYHQSLPETSFENTVGVRGLKWCPPNLHLASPERQKPLGLTWHSIPAPQSSMFFLSAHLLACLLLEGHIQNT